MTYSINTSCLTRGIRNAQRFHAEQQVSAGACPGGVCGPQQPGQLPHFVMQQKVRVNNQYFAPVPGRFAPQGAAPNRARIPHSERQRVVMHHEFGPSAAVIVPHANGRWITSPASVDDLKNAGATLAAIWPDAAPGLVTTTGSRVGHRGERKQYSFLKTNGVLVIRAHHRPGSDLEIHPDGRLLLGGQEVKADCSRKVQIRVINRLNVGADSINVQHHFAQPEPANSGPVAAQAPAADEQRPLIAEQRSLTAAQPLPAIALE